MEFLKQALGEELFAQVAAKLEGNDGIRLANLADGSVIPKDRFEAERAAGKQLKAQIAELTAKLGEMQTAADGADALKAKIAELTADIGKRDAEMARQALEYKVRDAVRGSKAKNADIVMRMIDMTKVAQDGENLIGLTDQLEALRKSDGYLFDGQPAQSGGVDPHTEPVAGETNGNALINSAIRAAVGR